MDGWGESVLCWSALFFFFFCGGRFVVRWDSDLYAFQFSRIICWRGVMVNISSIFNPLQWVFVWDVVCYVASLDALLYLKLGNLSYGVVDTIFFLLQGAKKLPGSCYVELDTWSLMTGRTHLRNCAQGLLKRAEMAHSNVQQWRVHDKS